MTIEQAKQLGRQYARLLNAGRLVDARFLESRFADETFGVDEERFRSAFFEGHDEVMSAAGEGK